MSKERIKYKFKYIANLYTGNSIKDEEKGNYEDSSEARPYISSKDINADNNSVDYDNGMYVKLDDTSFKVAPAHSSLMCVEGGSAGKKKTFLDRDVCFVNKLCCFAPKENINPKYLYYYLNNPEYEDLFKLNITGMIGGVSVSTLKDLPIYLPDIQEQQKIVDYIDKRYSKILSQKENYEKSIELLEEYKKSLITETVTKGLNKDVEMKDSGISWIGNIPNHYEIRRIKYTGDYRNGLTYSPTDLCGEEGTLVLRSSNIQGGKLDFEDNVYVSCKIDENLIVKDGDILICSRNGSQKLIGKTAIIENLENVSFGAFMMIYRSDYIPKYMYYILNSNIFEYYKGMFLTTTVNQLTGGNFGNMKIPFCSNKKEQKQIADYLDKKCSRIDKAILYREEMIKKLEEYRKSLVYECITGKKELL